MKIARKLTIASAAAVLAVGTLAGGVSAAAAAPAALVPTQFSLDLSPGGPYSGGDEVTGTASGFEPNEQVIFSVCIGGGKTLAGPQDCAELNGANTALGAADGDGNAELTIEVLEGPANFQSAPDYVCGNEAGQECVFSFSNFAGDGPTGVQIEYAEGGGGADDAAEDADAGDGDGDDAGADDAADDADAGASDELAATGAGPAAQSALLGALLLSFGALLAVGTRRQAARK